MSSLCQLLPRQRIIKLNRALIKGLELLKAVHPGAVEIFGDSMLVINQ